MRLNCCKRSQDIPLVKFLKWLYLLFQVKTQSSQSKILPSLQGKWNMNFPGCCGGKVHKEYFSLVRLKHWAALLVQPALPAGSGGLQGRLQCLWGWICPLNICSLTGQVPGPCVVKSPEQGRALLHGLVSHLHRGHRNIKTPVKGFNNSTLGLLQICVMHLYCIYMISLHKSSFFSCVGGK